MNHPFEEDYTHLSDDPPPKKKSWNHSEQVLVYYKGNEQNISTYSIAYYHYDPPFEDKPKWIDFSGKDYGRIPERWWKLTPLKEMDKL